MKNLIIVAFALVASLSPLVTASAGLKSDAAPIGDAVQSSDSSCRALPALSDEGSVIPDATFVIPEVTGTVIAVPIRKSTHQHVARKAVCDPVVYVLGGSSQNCR
jgi:hypothetical protein